MTSCCNILRFYLGLMIIYVELFSQICGKIVLQTFLKQEMTWYLTIHYLLWWCFFYLMSNKKLSLNPEKKTKVILLKIWKIHKIIWPIPSILLFPPFSISVILMSEQMQQYHNHYHYYSLFHFESITYLQLSEIMSFKISMVVNT